MFSGNAFTSVRYDRDESMLPPGPPDARDRGRSGNPLSITSDTLMTALRSLPSHSTEYEAMMASVAAASTAACTAFPSDRFENPTFQT